MFQLTISILTALTNITYLLISLRLIQGYQCINLAKYFKYFKPPKFRIPFNKEQPLLSEWCPSREGSTVHLV